MKKRVTTVIAAALAFTLAVPVAATPTSQAAGKAPKLTPDSATIFIGKTKTFTIKNVKKSNVKSLKVKTGSEKRVTVTKKIMKKNKVGFVLKANGGGLIQLDVVLKLKKAQAGKKSYKFELNLQTGSKEAPIIALTDKVSDNLFTALVLKEGTKAAEYPDTLDNAFELDIFNEDKIGARNMMVQWFVDGKEIESLTRDAAGSREYRPETTFTASGTAAGIERHEYYCVVENTFTGEKIESTRKVFCLVSQDFIDQGVAAMTEFQKKYPDPQNLNLDAASIPAFLADIKVVNRKLGSVLGGTDLMLAEMKNNIDKVKDNPELAAELIANDVGVFDESFVEVGEYLGVSKATVDAYCGYFDYIMTKYLTDPAFDFTKL